MNLHEIWERYRTSGLDGLSTLAPRQAMESFYAAILAFNAEAIDLAVTFSQIAHAQEPTNPLYSQATTYLRNVLEKGKKSVYVSAAGFAEFIRGGGNVSLYQAVSKALQEVYRQYPDLTLLDIGVGDGLALLPALTDNIRHIDVLEPSKSMLDRVRQELAGRSCSFEAFEATIQTFAQTSPRQPWDLVQSTFCLQSIPPTERPELFRWMARNSSRLVIVEFDVPEFTSECSPDHAKYVVERYGVGLAEYDETQDRVAQEFLMPVMFGYFDKTVARTNFEHPIRDWVKLLQSAGYRSIERIVLFPYWWAPAVLIDARI